MKSVPLRLNPSVRGELLVELFPSYVASGQRNLALTCRQRPTRNHTARLLCSASALPLSARAPTSHGLSYGPESWPPDNTGTTASSCTGSRTWRTPRPNQSTMPPSSNACRRRARRPGPWCCPNSDASGRHHFPSPDASGRRHLFHPSALPQRLDVR